MSFNLSELPVALVTGAGSGIGAATARKLSETHRIAICGRRLERLESLAKEINALTIRADVGVPDDVDHMMKRIIAEYGRIDSLVLNAGIMVSGTVSDTSLEDWNRVIRTNLTSVFLISKAALPYLSQNGGSIVTISSIAGIRTGPASSAYAASKAGVIALTQSIALDYAHLKIRANVICPGWVQTEMADEEMRALAADTGETLNQAYQRITKHIPERRPGQPEELAETIAWIISPAASFINGAVVPVDGGSAIVDVGMIEFLK